VLNKDKIKGELPSFSMLEVKCSVASPMLKHCSWHGKNNEHLVVKVILELHVAFSLSSFKSPPHA
jgi:hypothetical protein